MPRIVVGADHAGLPLKGPLVAHLKAKGWDVDDLGTHGPESVDYPDFAHALALEVAADDSLLGLLVCGSGVGMSISANRHASVRAVVCSEAYSARVARLHNNANVLCLGARVVGVGVGVEVLDTFLEAAFEGGRHARRVGKIELS
ncbi:MAG: ribose 5-phosphate isomerase B [Sandaracinaceae bacterium]